jgi:glyoxylase-like metal-dependent hydrolase (beta-lactamase superfamily II)
MAVHWNAGSPDCRPGAEPTIQVHAYNASTYVLRESLCATPDAPFTYLLIGSSRALLVDTGDIADAARAPLARTVLGLLPVTPAGRLPLSVVHTHAAVGQGSGDGQFVRLPGVQVVGADLASIRHFFGFSDWPQSSATIDLGDRAVDILPTPGPQAADLVYYDRQTGLMLTGEFLAPARLQVEDAAADADSARRIAAFAADRPIASVLGSRIEMDQDGALYPPGSRFHANERPLQLSRTELMALPDIVDGFHGVYARRGGFTLVNRTYELDLIEAALAIAVVVFMAGIAALVIRARRWLKTLSGRPKALEPLLPSESAPAT